MKSTFSDARSASARPGAIASSAAIAVKETTALADDVVKTAPSWKMCRLVLYWTDIRYQSSPGLASENHARWTDPAIRRSYWSLIGIIEPREAAAGCSA